MWRLSCWLAVAGAATSACSSVVAGHHAPPPAKSTMSRDLREHPGVPFVLPVETPDGFRFVMSTPRTGVNGYTTARGVAFASSPGRSASSVDFCIERHAPSRRICRVDADPGPRETIISRSLRDLVVRIRISGASPSAVRAWRTVRLTSDLDAATWLEAS